MEIIARAEAKACGLTRYFTGKSCTHGHISQRATSNGMCIECNHAWCKANRGKVNAKWRRWRLAHRESVDLRSRERQKQRRMADPIAARKREREYGKKWRAANPKKELEYTRRKRELNPDGQRLRKARRRARERQAENTFTVAEWRLLLARSRQCHWCKRSFNAKRRPTHDHVTPLSKGGANTLENSVCACSACNTRKNAKLINPVNGQGILL